MSPQPTANEWVVEIMLGAKEGVLLKVRELAFALGQKSAESVQMMVKAWFRGVSRTSGGYSRGHRTAACEPTEASLLRVERVVSPAEWAV